MTKLPKTLGHLDQSTWDVSLRLCHELYVRGVATPREKMTGDKIREILKSPALQSTELKQAERAEQAALTGHSVCACGNTTRDGATVCGRCRAAEVQKERNRIVIDGVSYKRKHKKFEANNKHPWVVAQHKAVLAQEERRIGGA